MIALPLSIILSTYLVVCFKFFDKYKINSLQAIVFNYIACVITGLIVSPQIANPVTIIHENWFLVAVILGCCFFCIFNLMAFVTKTSGITVTSVSSKLSMIIPITVAIALYHEKLTPLKIVSLLLAMVAVYLSSVKRKEGKQEIDMRGILLAFLVFIGSGLDDTLVNFASKKLMQPDDHTNFNISIFSFAALCGVVVLLYDAIFLRKAIQLKSIIAGIILGIPNYFSLLYLIKALSIPNWDSSVIFPINNMGIVVLSAISSYLIFSEKFSRANLAGIAIGIIAIGLMIFN